MSKQQRREAEVINTVNKMARDKPQRKNKPKNKRKKKGRRNNTYRNNRSIRNNHAYYRERLPRKLQPYGKTSLSRILTGSQLMKFLQATTHPFGPEGIGAVIPDRYDSMAISTYDPLEITVNLQQTFASSSFEASGFFAAIVPRCFASRLAEGDEVVDVESVPTIAYAGTTLKLGIVCVDYNFNQLQSTVDTDAEKNAYYYVPEDPYFLLIMVLDQSGFPVVYVNESGTSNYFIRHGIYLMRMPRMNTIKADTVQCRIVGAGIKLNPRSAPISTAGQCYSAQIKIADLMNKLITEFTNDPATTASGQFLNFQPLFYGKYVSNKGKEGATARYDIFQSREQLEKQQVILGYTTSVAITIENIEATKNNKKDDDSEEETKEQSPEYSRPGDPKWGKSKFVKIMADKLAKQKGALYKTKSRKRKQLNGYKTAADGGVKLDTTASGNLDISKDDLTDAGNTIPSVYYSFQDNTPIQLNLRAVVHMVCEPISSLPFPGTTVNYDPLFKEMSNLCPNQEIFPLVEKGNSFKTAFSKFAKMTGSIVKGASRFSNFLNIVESAL
jgi:hypothetical protein